MTGEQLKIIWTAIACCWIAIVCVWLLGYKCLRLLGQVNFRITQLAGGLVAPPKAPHPYDCPHCGERFKQRSWKPTEGERGYCGRCMVWHQVFPPIDAPGPREGV